MFIKNLFCFYQPTNFYRIRTRTVGSRIDTNDICEYLCYLWAIIF